MKKSLMFCLSKRGMCRRPIKAQDMPASVHYWHRHEKGADEPIILSRNWGANVNMNRGQNGR